jgi:uncharacterized protein DUF222/HNH endonuclease
MHIDLAPLRDAASRLASFDPSTTPPSAVAEQVVALRTLIDGLEGTWLRLVATVDRSGVADGGTGAWLRSDCRMSPAAARSQVALARRLADRPAVARAVTAGDISPDHARLVTTALAELAATDERLAADTEAPLLTAARTLDPVRLRREIAHARHALIPEAAAASDEAAHARRHLDVARTFDGAVAVHGVLDAEGGETLLAALTALATPAGATDGRTPGQRRADALVQLCRGRLDDGGLPSAGGVRPHLAVLVPYSALTGSALAPGGRRTAAVDRIRTAATGPGTGSIGAETRLMGAETRLMGAETSSSGTGPRLVGGETVWGSVVGPDTARRLACDASVSRVIVDPAGEPLDVGRRTRTIPAAIRTALVVRDRGCVHPGCDHPPQWTDAHHLRHWADGGPTSLENLVLLCRRHHRAVHEGRRPLVRERGRWRLVADDRIGPAAA